MVVLTASTLVQQNNVIECGITDCKGPWHGY